jgi:methyl-accepting chemotaxis protein
MLSIVIITTFFSRNVNHLLSANGWVNHTHEVIGEASLIMAAMVDIETGMRGFLVTGEDVFHEPYLGGGATFNKKMNALQTTVDDNQPQVQV